MAMTTTRSPSAVYTCDVARVTGPDRSTDKLTNITYTNETLYASGEFAPTAACARARTWAGRFANVHTVQQTKPEVRQLVIRKSWPSSSDMPTDDNAGVRTPTLVCTHLCALQSNHKKQPYYAACNDTITLYN
ncbi:unnamed protein product [Sphagnum balticum]